MKALEILKEYQYADECLGLMSGALNEAIAELEALQTKVTAYEMLVAQQENEIADLKKQLEPKTCDGCRWYDELRPSYCGNLEPCARSNHEWDKDRYEPEDTE